jgi:hypothetical protein
MRWLLCISFIFVCFFVVVKAEVPFLEEASRTNRPIVLFCLKEKDCPWSTLWRERLLQSPVLVEKLSAEAVVQIVQAPVSGVQLIAEELRLPLVILLDPSGKEFARLDYDGLEAEVFADRIVGVIEDFHEICLAIDEGVASLDEERLKELYTMSARLSDGSFRKWFLAKGVQQEKGLFFHFEKYATLLNALGSKHALVKKMKDKILARDPKNKQGAHREVAWLEFQRKASHLPAIGCSEQVLRKALAPLIAYRDKWANSGDEKQRLESWMAQFLREKEINNQSFATN